jgi:hypothetical protein
MAPSLKFLEDSLELWEARERRAHRNHQNSAKEGNKAREKFWIEKEREAEKMIDTRRQQIAKLGTWRPRMFTSGQLGLKFQYIWGDKGTPQKLAGHYSAGPRRADINALKAEMKSDHAFHAGKGWGGCSYEAMVADDGTLGLGNPIKRMSAGVASNNSNLVNILCPGTTGHRMTEAQKRTVLWYIRNAHTKVIPAPYRSPVRLTGLTLKGHKEFPGQSTACPDVMVIDYHEIARATK